jgi:hypothetical protein
MNYAKKILEELSKEDTDSDDLREFIEEFEKAMNSDDTTNDEMEFFKFAMDCFNEEALNELIKFKEERSSDKTKEEEK